MGNLRVRIDSAGAMTLEGPDGYGLQWETPPQSAAWHDTGVNQWACGHRLDAWSVADAVAFCERLGLAYEVARG